MKSSLRKSFFFSLGLGLSLLINICFRVYPVNFPQFKQDAVSRINSVFPHQDLAAKKQLIQEEYRRLKERYQDPWGQTYLLETDSWNWKRYVENILQSGHPGDALVKGRQLDTYTLIPSGRYIVEGQWFFYAAASAYRFFCRFQPIRLEKFLFYAPLLLSAVFILVLYLFCYSRFGNAAAFAACIYTGLAPLFLMRSCAGWFDTDVLTLLFPLVIIWAFINKRILLSALLIAVFALFWSYWWFVPVIIGLYLLLKKRFVRFIYFLILTCGLVFLFGGKGVFLSAQEMAERMFIYAGLSANSIWPNVLPTVDELSRSGARLIVSYTGNLALFILSGAYLEVIFLKTARKSNILDTDEPLAGIMAVWFMVMLFFAWQGKRFALFLALPLGIGLAWFLKDIGASFLCRLKKYRPFILAVVSAFTLITCLNNGYQAAKTRLFPQITDAWYNALTRINREASKEAIVNTWWSFGDWVTGIARRRVVFDNQSQNTPQTYWMSRFFLAQDEEEAFRILCMLDNGGNRAFELINERLRNLRASLEFLDKLLVSDEAAARRLLEDKLLKARADEIIALIFKQPEEPYVLVSNQMADKMETISAMAMRPPLKFYSDIFFGPDSDWKKILSAHGLKNVIPASVIELGGDNQYKEEFLKSSTVNYSILIYPSANGGYSARLLDRELARSLFARLYLLDAGGLKHFKHAFTQTEPSGDGCVKAFCAGV